MRNRSIGASFYPNFLQRPDEDDAFSRAAARGRDLATVLGMELFADRFALVGDDRALDLAAGAEVRLIVGPVGDVSSQARWTVRCDTLQKLHHRRIAPLVDYGVVGAAERFEAWSCGSRWLGAEAEAHRTLQSASAFLGACGLTPGRASIDAVYTSNQGYQAGAVLLPDQSAGYPISSAVSHEGEERDHFGLAHSERRVFANLVEILQFTGGARPYIVALFGPCGCGKTTLLRELARAARTSGFVPVAVDLVSRLDLPNARLCMLADEAGAQTWPALLDASVRWPRPHVLIATASEAVRGIDSVAIDRMTAEELEASVRPRPVDRAARAHVRRAAVRAQGLPGRFTQFFWRSAATWPTRARPRRIELPHVAEPSAVYEVGSSEAIDAAPVPSPSWPAPKELALLRKRMADAVQQVASGRQAAGIRHLRQTIGGLARRHDWLHATDGALELSRALLCRGLTEDAHAALEEARQYSARGAQESSLIDIATLHGQAWIDQGRLDDAENSISAALAAALAVNDVTRTAEASCALARCLFWKGQYVDAELALESLRDRALPPALTLQATRLAARIAVGRREFGRAMTSANAVVERASALGDPSVRAAGLCTAAFVHLAVEDLDAVTRDATAGLAAARAGRDRLRAIDAGLFLAEAARRRNRHAEAVATLERFRKIRRWLSAAMRARCDLLRELLSAPTRAAEVVGRHIAASGLQALNLFAPVDVSPAAIVNRSDPLTDQIVDILQLCQQADDEARVLAEVCDRIQRHLHAAGVAWVVGHEHTSTIVASTGGRIEAAVAARSMAAGIVVAPHRAEGRVEAAAPVWYGGAIIGALGARWTIGSPYDLSRAPAVLTMAAAAAAPLVAAVVTRRTLPASPALAELLGTSASMVELRRAIERAAAAPFAVLIDGESGSGKELVARALHRASPRRDRPFSSLNCAALPDDLVEAELFGHGRGAFTGAVGDRAGVFEEAHGGTLFLDEIGELSARAQAKVLRVLQEGELRRVGENVSRRIDVRILAATNRDLAKDAAGGRFRMDLLYRLDVIRLSVPALRERRDDIPLLLEHYWREAAARTGSRATLAAATLAALARYDWPGNVRELQNVLAALAVRSPKRGIVQPIALPPHFLTESAAHARRLDSARRLFEEHFVRAALVRTGGHRARAAAELGVTRQGLAKLMTRLGIDDRTEARAAHERPTLATED